jgi:mannose-6-phosphate isomerase-like protein (cupin superfamily)
VLADQARTDGSFSMFEVLAPRGTGAPPHLFVEADAFYYVLDGTVDMLVGHEVRAAAKGDFVFVPKGTPHARRTASETARVLHLRTPAGFERVLRAFGQQTQATEPPPPDWSGQETGPDAAQQLLDDLGCRLVAMQDPFAW